MARHHGHRLSGARDSSPLATFLRSPPKRKTPYPFGYGVATDGPPVLTSSISSIIVGRRDNAGLQLLRLTIRRKGLKVSLVPIRHRRDRPECLLVSCFDAASGW